MYLSRVPRYFAGTSREMCRRLRLRFRCDKMSRVLIVSGGEIDERLLADVLRSKIYDRVICADRGFAAADRAGVVPDAVIGDLDSLPEEYQEKLRMLSRRGETKLTVLNPEKDATDTEEALDLALACSPEEILLLGATGSRIDHMLGNLSLLKKAKDAGVRMMIQDAHNRIRLIEGTFTIRKEEQYGSYVSLLPFGEPASGVTLKGFYYPLRDAVLGYGNSLGISNEIASEEATVMIKRGSLLFIESLE